MEIYDVTVPLDVRVPIYPGDPAFRLDRVASLADGAVCNLSKLDCGVHTGTHVDAPVHFIEGAAGVDGLPLAAMLGRAEVVDATSLPGHVDAAALADLPIPAGTERLIFKTRNSRLWSSPAFVEDFVGVTAEAAVTLVERGVRLVGIDYLSIAPPGDPTPTHLALLKAGVVVLEGLDLRAVPPGSYDLVCLPARLVGADGAPARVVLRPLPS
jgi:arylformamidase